MKNTLKITVTIFVLTIIFVIYKSVGIQSTYYIPTKASETQNTVSLNTDSQITESYETSSETEGQTEVTSSEIQTAIPKTEQSVQDTPPNKETSTAKEEVIRPLKALEEEVINLLNLEREKEKLPPLIADDTYYSKVLLRAKECEEYWSHTRPNGENSMTVYADILDSNIKMICENLGKSFTTAPVIVNALMSSEGHRNNILNPNITHVCVAIITMTPTEESSSYISYAMAQHFYQKEEVK